MRYAALPIIPVLLFLCGCTSNADKRSGTTPVALAPTTQHLGAVGIGVSDLAASTEFYQNVLGLEILRTYELGYLNETVLGYSNSANRGAVLVLMNWPDDTQRDYDGTNVKNVFYVDDPKAVIDRIRALNGTIDREATPHKAVNGALVGLGRDPDNYVVEVLELPR